MSNGDSWDAIVIGSGIGGLSAAASFAQAGKRVLILERLPNFGGAATVYRHGSLTMESSLHEIDGDTVFGTNGAFARLGLTDKVTPIGTDYFCEVRGGPLRSPILVPRGFDAAEMALCAALPEAELPMENYIRDMRRLHDAVLGLTGIASHGLASLGGFLLSGGVLELLGDLRQTVERRLDKAFGEQEDAKCAVGAMLGYFDDDPAKLSFMIYGGIWGRYLESGGYYFNGGSRALTDALLQMARQAGGEARSRCAVTKVLIDDDGAACGVTYTNADGEIASAYASTIFANAAPSLLGEMLPEEARAGFLKPYESLEPSVSLFNLSLGLSRPAAEFGVNAYSTFVYPDDMTHFRQWPEVAARFGGVPGKAMPPYTIADYGRLDAGMRQPDDPYLLSICGIDRLDWWTGKDAATERADRQSWIDALIRDADRLFPGLAGAVTASELATARTMKSHLGTPTGEVYGFRPTPQRLFSSAPTPTTSIKGLYLSSAYTVSGGYAGAMQGGMMASDKALRRL